MPDIVSTPGTVQAKSAKKILYFVKGPIPSEKERAEAWAVGTAMFRNSLCHFEGDSVEACDAVAGSPPEDYLKKYPLVKPSAPAAPPAPAGSPPPPPPPKP